MKTLLLNDTYDWYHWGCTATSRAVRRRLIQHCGAITVLPIYATRKLPHLPVELEQFDDPGFFKQFANANDKLYELLSSHDLIVVNGEGSIHDLSRISVALLYLAYACKRFLGKQVRIINHSAYPVAASEGQDDLARAMYGKVYACLDDVAIRERRSYETMRDLGVRARLVFDCLPITVKECFKEPVPKRETVVFADGVNMGEDAVPALAGAMDHWRDRGFSVELLIGARANPAPESERLAGALASRVKSDMTVYRAESLKAWLAKIAGARLLVSGRFHHSIAAAFLGTPFVVFESNTPKNAALCRELGLEPPLSYGLSDIRGRLIERGDSALARSPLGDDVLRPLLARAEANFDALGAPACFSSTDRD